MSPAAAAARASSRASAESWNTPAFAASLIHSAFMLSFLRRAKADMQLAQLLLVDRRRSVGEQVLGALGFGKGDHVAEGFRAGHHGDDAIETEGDTSVRRRAVLQRLEQESELLLRFLRADRKSPEHLGLDLLAVDAHRAPADLRTVHHHVVGLGERRAGIAREQILVAVLGRG